MPSGSALTGANDYSQLPGYGTPLALPSRNTVSSYGSTPSGGGGYSGSSGGGGVSASDVGNLVSNAAPWLLSLFGPSDPNKPKSQASADNLSKMATTLFGQGASLSGTASSAIAPVLSYLKQVAGGDQSSLDAATQGTRQRVIDQYDTAKQATQFLPRSGGTASAVLGLEGKKASDLSTITANARTEGVKDLASLGTTLNSQALQAESTGASAEDRAFAAYSKLSEDEAKQQQSLGSSIGKTIASVIPFLFGL